MTQTKEERYQASLARYTTAMDNEKPDMVPIRPFVAEFAGKYAGYTCQEVSHDYEKAFDAARRCAAGFDWDAVVGNMVYVWTGLTHALGLKYYATPGVEIPADTAFQYREPPEGDAFMKADEYDRLIDDPTAFLYEVWLPRVSRRFGGPANAMEQSAALVKGSTAMLNYFMGFGVQAQRLREECGMPSALGGILKAPMDILADKFRGYLGLVEDVRTQPAKVLAACEALAPHIYHVARATADPARQAPVGFWMHRSGVPFFAPEVFDGIFWPTLKPIIEALWADRIRTLFYAEGNWDYHLDRFAELPERSIVYHVDQGDIFKAKKMLGGRFCLSGGIPNAMLAWSAPDQVRKFCREVIEGVAGDGGYIMDASAIIQNDARVENIAAMTEATREYGAYSSGVSRPPAAAPESPMKNPHATKMLGWTKTTPGLCTPWETEKVRLPGIQGDEAILRQTWEDLDGWGNMFIWQVLLSF